MGSTLLLLLNLSASFVTIDDELTGEPVEARATFCNGFAPIFVDSFRKL